jgi:isoleucyl-tRNA synthetase
VRRAYEVFDFQAAYHAILNFIVVDLSSLYIDVARDRLYCDAATSLKRRSTQTTLFIVLDTLLRMLAPLIPFTAEEVYAHLPGARLDSVHLLTMHPANPAWRDEALESRWQRLLQIRDEALKLLEGMRKAGAIGASLEASVSVAAGEGIDIETNRDLLKDLFIVSHVEPLGEADAANFRREAAGREDFMVDGAFVRVPVHPAITLVGRHAPGVKCARCWTYFDDGTDPELDARCRAVVRGQAS